MFIKISTKEKIYDVISVLPQIEKYVRNNERYSNLVKFLNNYTGENDDNLILPTIKEIQNTLSLTYTQLRDRVSELHDIVFKHDGVNLNYKDTHIVFYASYFGESAQIQVNQISHLPRIGDNISLPIFRGKIGTDFFYVEDVRHTFEGTTQQIDIRLIPGSFNSYWYHRKHKAFELGEVSIQDQIYLDDYELKNKLGLR